jgi:tetratricopeptide (TPR) repeat protein
VEVPLASRIVEVIADRGGAPGRRYNFGSGFIVHGRTVLTAGHVVVGARTVQVRNTDRKTWHARLDREFVSVTEPDLALVFIEDDTIDLPPFKLAVVDRDSPTATQVTGCRAVGYPKFATRRLPSGNEMRDTVEAPGLIPVLSQLKVGLLTLQVDKPPSPLPPDGQVLGDSSQWSGMSGAPVMTADEYLLGVVSEHAPREGPSAITVVPLSALEQDEDHQAWGPGLANARQWWLQLGVAGKKALRHFPVGSAQPPPTPAVAMRTLHPDLDRDFINREKKLQDLTDALAKGRRSFVIVGMPGVGKTAFAARAARQLASQPHVPDGTIFIDLHGFTEGQRPVEANDALGALLRTVGVDPKEIALLSQQERTAKWTDRLAGKKMLLLLDNAWSSDQVRPLLPATEETLVLITSRRWLPKGGSIIPLESLEPQVAARLFAELAERPGQPDLEPTDSGVADVVRLCGFLPLAIRLTAAQLKIHPTWTASNLAARLGDAADRLKVLTGETEHDSVAAAFDLSYRHLTPEQQRLFRYLGLHPGTDIDAYAAAALADTDLATAQDLLADLYGQNLIEEQSYGRYGLHDLIRQHARTLSAQEEPTARGDAIDRLFDYYLQMAATAGRYIIRHTPGAFPSIAHPPACAPVISNPEKANSWLMEERPNLQAVTDYAALTARPAYAIGIPTELAGFLRIRGFWDQALRMQQTALDAAKRVGDRQGEADALNNLGGVQQATNNYTAATINHGLAVDLYHDLGNKQGEADALSDLAIVQRLTGHYDDVKSGLARAQALYHEVGDSFGEAKARNDLGIVYRLTGDYAAAADSLAKALNLLQGDSLGRANALAELGIVYRLKEDYPAAASSLTEALNLHRDIGSVHGQADALKELGVVYRLEEDYPAAATSLDKALTLYRGIHDRKCEAETLNNYGQVRSASSAPAAARADFTKALQIAQDLNVPLEEARALAGTGESYLQEGDTEQGITPLREALAIFQRLGSPDAGRVEAILRDHDRLSAVARRLNAVLYPGGRRDSIDDGVLHRAVGPSAIPAAGEDPVPREPCGDRANRILASVLLAASRCFRAVVHRQARPGAAR